MIELGLQRISRLLSTTALPWKAIHVAGTNGKGTVCHLTSAFLDAYNRSQYRKNLNQPLIKHGRFTSPHLVDRWDCIAFSDSDSIAMNVVSESDFLQEERAVKDFDEQNNISASEFEILTATAFRLFTAKELDVAVVEVGLGGLLDATNIIGEPVSGSTETKLIRKRFNPAKWRPRPLITAITQIGLDHQGFLGNTRAEIATQKAGIMKANTPVAWAPDAELDTMFETKARDLHAPVIRWEDLPIVKKSWQVLTPRRINGELAIISAWTALSSLGRITEPDEARQSGSDLYQLVDSWQDIIHDYVFPGRHERISLEPVINRPRTALLDGAHNEDGINLLAEAVQNSLRSASKPIIWVVALSESTDRDPVKILESLLREGDHVIAVEFGPVDGMPWVKARSAEQIAEAADAVRPGIDARSVGRDLHGALVSACELADEDEGEVVICGSLYLAGDTHRLLREMR